jgi:hypothetical protein
MVMVARQKVTVVSGAAVLMLVTSCEFGKAPISFEQTNGGNATQTACAQKQDGTVNNGLVAYWPFDEESGTAVLDQSGNGHNGTMVGYAQRTAGVSGNALLNMGRNGGVDVPDDSAFALTKSLTLSLWLRVDTWIEGQMLVFFRGDSRPGYDPYVLAVDYPSKTIRFQVQDNASVPNGGNYDTVRAPVDSGTWVLVTGVFDTKCDTKTLALYVNGKRVSQKTTTVSPFAALDANQGPGVGIGHHAMRSSNDYGFAGAVDEVRLYSRALSATEIAKESGGEKVCWIHRHHHRHHYRHYR